MTCKLNGTHQRLVYADNVNVLDGRVHAVKINTETLVVVSKESRVVVNADRTKYVVMSRDQNAGRNHNIKTDNLSLKSVEVFKYLGTNLTNQILFRKKLRAD
jgi:ribosomal protein L30E